MLAHHKIKIIKGTKDSWCWYKGRIGEKFEVTKAKIFDETLVYQVVNGGYTLAIIRVEDTELVQNIQVIDMKICRKCGFFKDIKEIKTCSYCGCEY